MNEQTPTPISPRAAAEFVRRTVEVVSRSDSPDRVVEHPGIKATLERIRAMSPAAHQDATKRIYDAISRRQDQILAALAAQFDGTEHTEPGPLTGRTVRDIERDADAASAAEVGTSEYMSMASFWSLLLGLLVVVIGVIVGATAPNLNGQALLAVILCAVGGAAAVAGLAGGLAFTDPDDPES